MEKTYARFLVEVDEKKEPDRGTKIGPYKLTYGRLDEKTAEQVKKQMAEYTLSVYERYETEYDDDDYPSVSHDYKRFELENIVSLSSGCYSTDEAQGDILVLNGQFAGVVIKARRWGGNGFSNYDDWWYCILQADGTIVGKNESEYSFYGSSSSKERSWEYTLVKKEG